jgi:hypothetical protein
MKVDLVQLSKALNKLYYETTAYKGVDTLEANVELIEADPGNGIMTDIIRVTAEFDNVDAVPPNRRMGVIEMYPSDNSINPRIWITSSHEIK